MAGSGDLEHPELDAMLERVKLTRGSDDKPSIEVCGIVEYLIVSVCYEYLFWFNNFSGSTLTLILTLALALLTLRDADFGRDERL